MEELFQAIEEKIRQSGYGGPVDGEAVYNAICDEIDDKENGTYLFLTKQENGDVFQYTVEVMDDSFNLSQLQITAAEKIFHIDFDK